MAGFAVILVDFYDSVLFIPAIGTTSSLDYLVYKVVRNDMLDT